MRLNENKRKNVYELIWNWIRNKFRFENEIFSRKKTKLEPIYVDATPTTKTTESWIKSNKIYNLRFYQRKCDWLLNLETECSGHVLEEVFVY